MNLIRIKFTIITLLILLTTATWATNEDIIVGEGNIQNSLENQLQEGHWELVMLWATYCHVCKEDFKKLAAFIEDNDEVPLTIIGIVIDGLDEKEKTHALVKDNQLNYVHILTNYEHAKDLYKKTTSNSLVGTPSYLLYNRKMN